jgi:hypothetical protein
MTTNTRDRKRRPWLRRLSLAILPAVAALAAILWLRTPSFDREWTDDVARLADIAAAEDGTVLISNIRDWDYDADGPVRKRWEDGTYDPRLLRAIWFNLDPFPAWDGVAHTFLVFEFAEGTPSRFLGVSVEARKQRGETYSGLKGLFRQYELLYVWASESDLIKRRAVYLDEDVYQYRLNLKPEQMALIFNAFLERTRELTREPRFYNTLLSNCTNELAATIRGNGGNLPWHYSYYLTGHADRFLHRLGYIVPADSDFPDIRAAALQTSTVLANGGLSGNAFSEAIRRLR